MKNAQERYHLIKIHSKFRVDPAWLQGDDKILCCYHLDFLARHVPACRVFFCGGVRVEQIEGGSGITGKPSRWSAQKETDAGGDRSCIERACDGLGRPERRTGLNFRGAVFLS